MDLETTRPRGRPINRWLDEVREDLKIVVGGEWQEWKKLLRWQDSSHSAQANGIKNEHSPDITQIPAMVAQSRMKNWIGESLSCVTWTLRALTSYLKNIPGIP
jgi:hypothetical protein